MVNNRNLLVAARAEAIFTSHLAIGSQPTGTEAAAIICAAVRAYGGTRGCAAEVAAAYGERPETAAPRMRWARAVIEHIYDRQPPRASYATTATVDRTMPRRTS
jgi:hypothetical protein